MAVYSMRHQQEIEDFVLRFGAFVPKDQRERFVSWMMEIVQRTGEESVESFVKMIKESALKGERLS